LTGCLEIVLVNQRIFAVLNRVATRGVIMQKYSTFCGLYCGACTSQIAFEAMAVNPEAKPISDDPADAPCPGCGSPEMLNCEFAVCCQTHQVTSCAFCPDFPCAMLQKFQTDEWPHHIDVIENLNRIREVGMDTWLKEQKQAWSCPQCGANIHWYQAVCTECGESWLPRY
jgi:hypothetical protein